ncbi:MAG: hypothetical protein ACYCQJ_05640 [Nitrososphaerales archaeon]
MGFVLLIAGFLVAGLGLGGKNRISMQKNGKFAIEGFAAIMAIIGIILIILWLMGGLNTSFLSG